MDRDRVHSPAAHTQPGATKPVPYRPTSGCEGAEFMASFCDRCQRDAAFRNGTGDSCPIIANSMVYEVGDDGYPAELIHDPYDGYPTCTAYSRALHPTTDAAAESDGGKR